MVQKTWKLVFTITDESDRDNLLAKGDIEEICEDVKTEMEKFTKPPLKVEYTIEGCEEVMGCPNCGADVVLTRVNDQQSGICGKCGRKIEVENL